MISPHKDTSMNNMCHGGEMAKCCCYAHIVWWRNSLHMIHDMESCDQSGEDQDKACSMDRLQWWRASQGFEVRDRVAVKLEQDLVPMDRGNGEERARSRSMDQRGHVMIWRGSYHSRKIKPSVDLWWWSKGLMEFGACVASIFGKMKWNVQGKGMTCRTFHFTGQRLCREVHDRIYNRWSYYQEGQNCLYIGHLVHLSDLTLRCC